jgi:superfamily I DNA and/or RNA helicase
MVRQLVKRGERVLVTAESNTAVDNLVELLSDMKIVRLGHPSRVDGRLKKHTLPPSSSITPITGGLRK